VKSVLVAAAVLLAAPAVSEAATWKQVTAQGGTSIDQVAHVRTADGVLHVVWHKGGDLTHTAIRANGKLGASSPIQSGWAGNMDPAGTAVPGGLRVVWGGIRTVDAGDPNVDLNSAFSTDGGASWALTPGSIIPVGGQAYGSDASAATLPNGTVLEAWAGTLGTWVHAGFDPATPNFDYQAPLGTYGYNPGITTDASGRAMMAWFSNSDAHTGVIAQAVGPNGAPAGPALTMPGTQVLKGGGSLARTAIVSRPKSGGFYVGYASGYPTSNRVQVWRVGDAKSIQLAKTSANAQVSISADPKGRIWAVWSDGTFGEKRILAARSNKSATRFGASVDLGAVKDASSAYSVDGNASGSALDVLVLFGVGTEPGGATYHTRALPGLSLSARKASKTVTFTVSDAGDPVRSATVKLAGRSGKTNSAGKVTLTRARARATATASGYSPATLKVK
jgi:hypothetical protein